MADIDNDEQALHSNKGKEVEEPRCDKDDLDEEDERGCDKYYLDQDVEEEDEMSAGVIKMSWMLKVVLGNNYEERPLSIGVEDRRRWGLRMNRLHLGP
ncbi:hypothetical protein GOP47_0024631 [Adiantum capillus-veneris]|uniref:Uncharacterized protein n=1 Tax=Adiantum capillus-veneris TaxID=13818 RepID=A0A9D4U4T4_ADICA|nr:hypothetical protein GOP47_0024631 [Adiantum capillus-veneris]